MKKLFHSRKIAGSSPGSLVFTGRQKVEQPQITELVYNPQKWQRNVYQDISELSTERDPVSVYWYRVTGVHNAELIREIGQHFSLSDLVLEDILNLNQRSKLDVLDDYAFFTLRLIYPNGENKLQSEQFSMLLRNNVVITFEESEHRVFDLLAGRIENSKGRVRQNSADYLAYRLLDTIVDYYFVAAEFFEQRIEDLEDRVELEVKNEQLREIHTLKKELNEFRRSVRPVQEVIGGLLRDDTGILLEQQAPFLRDLADHIINNIEHIDSLRENINSIRDLYMSGLSNRMNQIMKVLTVISTLFIPLSFLAGVYGMNFDILPELHWRYGYVMFWGFSVTLVFSMILWFRYRKWL